MKINKKGVVPGRPSTEVVQDLLTQPRLQLPQLDRIVTAPVFASNGRIERTPGYHRDSRTYYVEERGISIPEVPTRPKTSDISRAKDLIVEELLGDFPFVSDSERAHAIALFLLPFIRELIAGVTPLHLVEASSPGTGKTLMVKAILSVSVGRSQTVMSEPRDEDEMRKKMTATLLRAPTAIVFDNLTKPLDSGTLAGVLTTENYEDRILGVSQNISLMVRSAFVATGNNPRVSTEIARRSIRIRLDAGHERPWERKNLRQPRLLEWVSENRGDLIWAALTLVRAWLFEGRPEGTGTLGMFEPWAATVGGVLDVIAIPGFLANQQEFYADSTDELETWKALVQAWWDRFRDTPVGVRELLPLVEETVLIDFKGQSYHSKATSLGKRLQEKRDARFGDFRIEAVGHYTGAAQWRLRRLTEAPERRSIEPPEPDELF